MLSTKAYRMRAEGAGLTVRTSIPKEFILKAALDRGMSLNKFLRRYNIVWNYSLDTNFVEFSFLERKNVSIKKKSVTDSQSIPVLETVA